MQSHAHWNESGCGLLCVFRFAICACFQAAAIGGIVGLDADSLLGQQEDQFLKIALSRDEQAWIDQKLSSMTLEDRIGQLLMIRAHSDKGPEYELAVRDIIEEHHVGGVLFFQGSAQRQAELTNEYQVVSDHVPLLVAMDAEWGLGMRLASSTISYPRAIALGAIGDNQWIYRLGSEIGRQCRRLGVHVNFAPVLDVNNNPKNPVINDRSFGEDAQNVAAKGLAYVQGLQDRQVLACGKHFPGHGDTEVDSHYDLPIISHDRQRLSSLEFIPFQCLFQRGLGSVMVAHLSVPALDPRTNRPATLSQPIVDQILRREMGYEGLIFTDALEMKGITKFFPPGVAEVEAFKAGNDVLLLPENVAQSVTALRDAIEAGEITHQRLDSSVRRILRTKYRLGLHQPQRVVLENLDSDLNTPQAQQLRHDLLQQAVVLVRDAKNILPLPPRSQIRLGTLAIGSAEPTEFQNACSQYQSTVHAQLPKEAETSQWSEVVQQLKEVDLLLICFHGLNRDPKTNFGLSSTDVQRVRRLAASRPVAVVHFGNPYGLANYDGLPTVVLAFEESKEAQEIVAKAVFGELLLKGTLPVTASLEARFGDGLLRRE